VLHLELELKLFTLEIHLLFQWAIYMNIPKILLAHHTAKPLNVGGFEITVLASAEETGSYELFRLVGTEGKGPGPHYHPWDESFYVLRGAVQCGVHDRETLAYPGTFIHVPGGTTHWFTFGHGGGELFSITSHGNATKMFTAFDKEVNWESPDRKKLIELAARYGQIVLP